MKPMPGENYGQYKARQLLEREHDREKFQGDAAGLAKYERAAEVADAIELILMGVDLAFMRHAITAEELGKMHAEMEERNESLGAWPFPATLNTAHRRKMELAVLGAMVQLFAEREHWREHGEEQPFITDEQVREIFGL